MEEQELLEAGLGRDPDLSDNLSSGNPEWAFRTSGSEGAEAALTLGRHAKSIATSA